MDRFFVISVGRICLNLWNGKRQTRLHRSGSGVCFFFGDGHSIAWWRHRPWKSVRIGWQRGF
jgi:hypothetical protein